MHHHHLALDPPAPGHEQGRGGVRGRLVLEDQAAMREARPRLQALRRPGDLGDVEHGSGRVDPDEVAAAHIGELLPEQGGAEGQLLDAARCPHVERLHEVQGAPVGLA